MEKISEELKEVSFGLELLHALGYIYEQKARQYIGEGKFLGIGGFYHGTKEKFHLVSEAISTVSAALELQNAAEKMQKNEAQLENDQYAKAKLEQETAKKGIEAMWKLNKLDIEATIRNVCDSVLRDQGVDKSIREKRAEALKALGVIFTQVKGVQPTLDRLFDSGAHH